MDYINILSKIKNKNRTIVSRDNQWCLEQFETRKPIKFIKFASGKEFDTWPIPPEWHVNQAYIEVNGKRIVDYAQRPMFVAPYSLSFSGEISKEELTKHCLTFPEKPDAFPYEHRLAYNFQRRLKEWRVALPSNLLKSLPHDGIKVVIETETRPGHLLLGDMTYKGESAYTFCLLAHYCHVSQVNDGIAGAAVMLEVINRLFVRNQKTKYSYKALLVPETIGSVVYASVHGRALNNFIGAVFTEMPGASAELVLVRSRRSNTYIDRVFAYVCKKANANTFSELPFRGSWGNDELVFDSPGVGVPAVSLDRRPFPEYHTHFDDIDRCSAAKIEETVETILSAIDILERDFIPVFKNKVPVYLSKYQLYSDWTYEKDLHRTNTTLIDQAWSGRSAFDIALAHDIDPQYAFNYYENFVKNGLMDKLIVSADYTRKTE